MKYRTIGAAQFWLWTLWAIGAGPTADAPGQPALPLPAQDLAARSQPDPRVRRYVTPQRILWQSKEPGAVVENARHLLEPFAGQITLEHRAACVLRHQGRAPGVLLDFGRELHGGLQIAVQDLKAASPADKTVRVRVRFGESAAEAMSELGGDSNAGNDHAVRDQVIRVPWLGTVEVGQTGFRFVRLDLVEPDSFVALKAVRAVLVYRDLPYLGSFECNDARLNRIWQTGAYTVHLNLQDYVWDGIKRDRLVWIGDMHPETMTVLTVFGALPIVPASLDLVRDQTPLPRWMNGISSYSMWWVLIQHSWYRYTGDRTYLQAQHGYLRGLLSQLAKHIGPDGAERLPETRFLDWPSSQNKKAIHAGLQALMVLSFRAGAELSEALGDEALGRTCLEAVGRLRQHVPEHGGSKQAAALLALAGLGQPSVLNRQVLAVDGPRRLSTFYGYYVLQARAQAADYQGCLDTIRAYWGGMLDLGATSFWEDFDLDWTNNAARIDELVPPGKADVHGQFGNYCYKGFRHSLCHGWASGPTAWLSEHVLGVQGLAPGCSRVRIQPHLGDLQWVQGSFPTPHGLIRLRHERQPDGSVKSTVDAPPGVQVQRD